MITGKKASVVEVGPRDGFQNIKGFIPTDTKFRIIEDMFAAGIREMEITSFVSPKAIPQMADAKELAERVVRKYGEERRLIALVPNLRGAQMAVECGLNTVTFVISASERHNKENVRKTPAESLADLNQLLKDIPGLNVRLDVATAFGCPFLGSIPEDMVMNLANEAASYGVKEIVLCDTIGIASPNQVAKLSKRALAELKIPVGLHLHDTRGLGLANALSGLQEGVTIFETSVAGLGGCPFAPGASGNTATEDLLNMMNGLDVETGISITKYLKAVDAVIKEVQSTAGGHLAKVPMNCTR